MATYTAKLEPSGRLLIPASLRQKLGITPGVEVIIEEDDGILLVQSRESAVRRAQEYFARFNDGRSWSEELLEERRGKRIGREHSLANFILDASALLALLQKEPGADSVSEMLPKAAISAVNMAEVVAKLVQKTGDPRTVVRTLRLLNLPVLPWDESAAYGSGEIAHLAGKGLSLGDRACLTQAAISNAMAATSDRSWKELQEIGDRVTLIR